jgi:hypothetical protein
MCSPLGWTEQPRASPGPRTPWWYGQELSLLYGQMNTPDGQNSTFSWQVEFRKNFYRYLSWSADYINEGHIVAHKRDGGASQLWMRWPLFDTHSLWISAGAGAYRYFDTTVAADGVSSQDLHGWAQIYSAAVTWYAPERFFARMLVNRIVAGGDIDTQTVVFGVGYRLWKSNDDERRPSAADASAQTTFQEIWGAAGDSVENTFKDSKGIASEVEYRQGFARHGDWSVSLVNEDGFHSTTRTEVAPQIWVVDAYLNRHLMLGFGIGPTLILDSERSTEAAENTLGNVVGAIATGTIAWRFGDHWLARFAWHRVLSRYNPDMDVFVVGPGYRWGV